MRSGAHHLSEHGRVSIDSAPYGRASDRHLNARGLCCPRPYRQRYHHRSAVAVCRGRRSCAFGRSRGFGERLLLPFSVVLFEPCRKEQKTTPATGEKRFPIGVSGNACVRWRRIAQSQNNILPRGGRPVKDDAPGPWWAQEASAAM